MRFRAASNANSPTRGIGWPTIRASSLWRFLPNCAGLRKGLGVLLACVLLSACDSGNELPESYTAEVCVEHHTRLIPMPMRVGKVTVLRMQPSRVCDRYEWRTAL